MYKRLLQGAAWPCEKIIWKAKLPMYTKIFIWQMAICRLPSSEQINHIHGLTDGKCALCGEIETINHIFFSCALAKFMWSGIMAVLNVSQSPSSFAQFFHILSALLHNHRVAVWALFDA
jgi:hypothetical protein